MLRGFTEHGAGEDDVAASEGQRPAQQCVRPDDAARADAHAAFDDRERADDDVVRHFGLGRDHGGRMNPRRWRNGHNAHPVPWEIARPSIRQSGGAMPEQFYFTPSPRRAFDAPGTSSENTPGTRFGQPG